MVVDNFAQLVDLGSFVPLVVVVVEAAAAAALVVDHHLHCCIRHL